ncbi:MAG: zinc metallopeptidase [Clostridia bacterium]
MSIVQILILIVGIAIVVVGIVGAVVYAMVHIRYFSYNRKKVESKKTGAEVAREMLDKHGLTSCEVKTPNFFRMIAFGNSYSHRKKTVYLRKGIYNRNTITAVAMACQKAGLAIEDSEDGAKFVKRQRYAIMSIVGPQSVIPLLFIGVALDLIVAFSTPIFTLIALVFALILFLSSLAFTWIQIPIEKRGVEIATEMIQKYNLVSDEEFEKIKKLYKVYILDFVLAFIMEILQVIKVILQFILKFANADEN